MILKKKLLITVGAGASVEFGLPSVSAIDEILDQSAGELYPLADDPSSNLYRYCRDKIEGYYRTAPKPYLQKFVNFEEVFYQLNLLSAYASDSYRQHGSNALLAIRPLPDVLQFGLTRTAVNGHVLSGMTSELIDVLVDYFIDTCATVSPLKAAGMIELGRFLAALQDEFDIGIITLNYDNTFTQTLPGLHTGFDTAGKFNAMSVLARTEWHFIYHLHGSVHFAQTGSRYDMHDITWAAAPSVCAHVHALGRTDQESMEGTSYPISPFVAGYGKAQQILRQPFRTYFSQVNRIVQEADSLLLLGYGFSDLHLNAVFSEVRDRYRPIVIVDWASDNEDPLPSRNDRWTRNLFKTLPGNAYSMSSPGRLVPALMSSLKAEKQLEVSTNSSYPLAVWYNGFLEACRNSEKILTYLR